MAITTYPTMRRRHVRVALEGLNTQLVAVGGTAVTIPRALAPMQVRRVLSEIYAQAAGLGAVADAPSRSLSRRKVDDNLLSVQTAVAGASSGDGSMWDDNVLWDDDAEWED